MSRPDPYGDPRSGDPGRGDLGRSAPRPFPTQPPKRGPVRAPGRDLLEPLERTLRWQLGLIDTKGRILCPEHGVEHTGKSACTAILALELLRRTPDELLTRAAVQQGERLVANLVREGTSPCHTFRPGRHDPFNCSNSVIDGGAAADALGSLVEHLGDSLDAATRERFAAACLLHARTYLRYAVLDKGIPAQRAWGLTGLAAAARLERRLGETSDHTLEHAAIEAVGVLEAIQNPDGSYPYHPMAWGAGHIGAGDVSAFYQSRVTGFLLHSLDTLERVPTDPLFRTPLVRGLDFLVALQGVDGIKAGLVEAKPWYWGADYEVASHPFDVHALAAGHRWFGAAAYGRAAHRAFRAWAEHLDADGKPQSHRPGPGRERSYQCPVFWAAHAAWAARALDDLEAARHVLDEREPGTGEMELSLTWFPSAQLGRVEDGRVVAWVRGARPGCNAHHGSPHGAGLIRVQRRADGAELLKRCRLGGAQEAEWNGRAGAPSPVRGWRSGGDELRFSLWLARVAWRRGERAGALALPARVFSRAVLAPAHPRCSSAFHLAPSVHLLGDGIQLEGGLAWRDGTPVPGARLERTFRVDGDGLEVEERLVARGAAGSLGYRVPAAAAQVSQSADAVRYRLA